MGLSADQLLLYAITNRGQEDRQTFLAQIEAALQGGVTILQLREKNLDDASFIDEAIAVKEICRKYQVPLIINDRLQVALQSGADGVHAGIEDQPVAEIRRLAGKDFIIGATAKTVEQARLAYQTGADYLGVGAVFPSPTKAVAIRITEQQLIEICSAVPIPAVAIGGITEENITDLNGSPIDGVAVVSAIFSDSDPKAAAGRLRILAEQITGKESSI